MLLKITGKKTIVLERFEIKQDVFQSLPTELPQVDLAADHAFIFSR